MGRTRQVAVGKVVFGSGKLVLLAGPCAIENEAQFRSCAQAVKTAGAHILRAGFFKLRTNPQSFQGLGSDAFRLAEQVSAETELPLVSEVIDPRHVEKMAQITNLFQVGTRNMYNYPLLRELGLSGKPVLLKRAFAATLDEWLLAAEYIQSAGNPNVILCERGIRTFENSTRNTLDLNSVAWLKANTDYPIVVDPSHGTGRAQLVAPMALAAAACGADGLMIEVHTSPTQSLSDGEQALLPAEFTSLTQQLERLLASQERSLWKI